MSEPHDDSKLDNWGRGAVSNLLKACWKHQDHLWPATKAVTVYRSGEMRISLASLLRLEQDGNFLLVRNPHRPESYVPFGGVFKYYPMAVGHLDRMEFKSQQSPEGQFDDFERDLRGNLPARNLPVFLNWFKARQGREEQDCIRRELREELQEIQAPESITSAVGQLAFTLVRRVHEGPMKHVNLQVPQFRYFEIYRPAIDTEAAQVVSAIFSMVDERPNELLVASTNEINKLRARDGRVIGGHSQYLLSSKWHGVEPPQITDR